MFKYVFQGFLLGLAYVAPIGMQNLYVINTAINLTRKRAYYVALITVFFDVSLAISCFLGIGFIMDKFPLLKNIVLLIGGLVVIYIGLSLIRSSPSVSKEINVNKPMKQIIATCFTVTWLNPQALIDGSLLLGGFRASLPSFQAKLFIAGVCLASLMWFTGLATTVSIFKKAFNIKIIRWINILCGLIIILYGVKLLYTFINTI